MALERVPGSDTDPSRVLERPKVIHNHKTGKFVMWLHVDDEEYEWAKLGVAVSDFATGPFEFVKSFRPHDDQESRDFTVWKVRYMSLLLGYEGYFGS